MKLELVKSFLFCDLIYIKVNVKTMNNSNKSFSQSCDST